MRPSRVVHSLGWFGTSLRSSLSILPVVSLLLSFLTTDVNHLTLLCLFPPFYFLFFIFYFWKILSVGKLVLLEFQQEIFFVVIDGSFVFS